MTARLRRLVGRRGLFTAVGVASALTVSAAAPAEAQVFNVLTIEPTEGPVGAVVTGSVDLAVIPENCSTSPEELVAEGTAEAAEFQAAANEFTQETWPEGRPDSATDAQSFGADLVGATVIGALSIPDVSQMVWERSFVLTFADIATQQPVGELSSFDPETGVGQVAVPDVDPGQWAVAATCLHWNTEITADTIGQAVAVATDFVEANLTAPYPSFGDPEFTAIAEEVGPSVLGNILLLPGELWVALFSVTGDPGDPGGPGVPGGPGTPPTAPPATPVPGDPDFTG